MCNYFNLHRNICFFLLFFILFSTTSNETASARDTNRIILIINSYSESAPWSGNNTATIMHEVAQMDKAVAYEEDMNLLVMNSERRMNLFTANLFKKYSGQYKPDYLILIGNASFSFRELIKQHWGDIPTIVCAEEDFMVAPACYITGNTAEPYGHVPMENLRKEYNFTFLHAKRYIEENIELMRTMIPGMRKLIFGSDSLYINWQHERAIKAYLKEKHPEIEYERIIAGRREINGLLHLLNHQAKKTGLLLGSWLYHTTDLVGNMEIRTGVYRIIANAEIPSFGVKEAGMEDGGMVGGYVYYQKDFSDQLRDVLRQVVSGRAPRDIPFYTPQAGPVFNYPMLVNKGISTDRCPEGSLFIDKPEGFWKAYGWYFGTGVAIVCLFIVFQEKRIKILNKLRNIQQKELELSNKYNDLINNMPILYMKEKVVRNEKGAIIDTVYCDTNGFFKRNFFKGENTIGRTGSELFPDSLREFIHFIKIALEERKSVTFSYYFKAINAFYDVVVSCCSEPDTVDIFCVDMTSLHKIQQQLHITNHKLGMALDIANVIPWKWDLQKRIISYDATQTDGLTDGTMDTGGRQRSVTEDYYFAQIHKDDYEKVRGAYEELVSGKKAKILQEYRVFNKDKYGCHIDWMEVQAIVYQRDPEGHLVSLIGSSLVITERKKMEHDLLNARDRAEESNRLKSAFLANMSHEIRTPLNAIVGFSSILASTEDLSERQEYVSIIENNNNLLLQLISDILDLSKIEAGTLEFVYSDIDLNQLLEEIRETIHLKIDAAKVELRLEKESSRPFGIRTERNRLSQVLINLLTNASKFTREGSIAFGYKQQKDMLYFHVTDTGCGIPAERQGDVFKRFVKLDTFVQGTGLGLAICQTIVRHMGGEIGLESEPGKGSTFWFTLPYVPAGIKKAEEDQGIQPEKVKKNDLTILIAEDNDSNYRLYNSILGNDYRLLHAWNGKEAVEMYRQYHPHLILMDINMPEMDGYEATREIREMSTTVPIVAVTAYAYISDEKKVMERGFNGYMAKPIKAPALKQEVTAMLNKRIILM